MKNLTPLTSEQLKRVNNHLLNSQKNLAKELSYSVDLQDLNRISEIELHISKLNSIILNGWNAPKFN